MTDVIHVKDHNTGSLASETSETEESRTDHTGKRRKRNRDKSKQNGAIGKNGDAADSSLPWLASQFAAELATQSLFECITDAMFFGMREREQGFSERTQEKIEYAKVKVLVSKSFKHGKRLCGTSESMSNFVCIAC